MVEVELRVEVGRYNYSIGLLLKGNILYLAGNEVLRGGGGGCKRGRAGRRWNVTLRPRATVDMDI